MFREVTITITGANDAPVADAGAGQLVLELTDVMLSGSGSDPDTGDAIEFYTWTQTGGTPVMLTGEQTATLTFTALEVDTAPELVFTLVVSDGDVTSLPDTVTVTVRDAPADGDVIILGEIDGQVTEDDPAANTASGALRVSGGEGTFTEQDGTTDRASGLGTYGRFELTESGGWTYTLDNEDAETNALAAGMSVVDVFTAVLGSGSTQTVTITITGSNDAPVADAGAGQLVIELMEVTLSGRGSFDPDTGDVIESYTWMQIGDSSDLVTITGADTVTATFTAPTVETVTTLTFMLVVNDGDADSLPDMVTVTVRDTPADGEIIIIGEIDGRVTEDNAAANTAIGMLDVVGDEGGFMAQTTAAATVGLGTYGRFELTENGEWTYTLDNADPDTNALAAGEEVTDVFTAVSRADATVSQVVTITITGANDAPMADAGQDRNVTSGSTVTLLGSGSFDPDTSDLLSYEWEQTGGMAVPLSSAAVATPTFEAPTVPSATDLMFTLTVTDARGLTDTAAVTLTVLADGVRLVSLVPGIDTLVEESDAIELVVSLDATPTGLVLVQLDSLQTVPSVTPVNVTYGLDYSVILDSTDAACDTTDFSFDSATAETLMSRRVVVPFPAGCASQTLMVSAIDDVDGLDETLTFSLVEEGASYAVTLIPDGAVRDLTVTDNEPVVELLPLGDPSVTVRGVVTERNFITVDVLLPGYVAGTTPVTVNVAVSGDIDEGDVEGRLPGQPPLTALSMLVIDGSTTLAGAPGQRENFITIPDGIVEEDETATVTLLAGDGYRLPATNVSRSVTILDSLRATIPDTAERTAVEGGAPAIVTVQLSRRVRPSLNEDASLLFAVQPTEGSYTVSGPAGEGRTGNLYRVRVPFDNDDVNSIAVTITATEDDDAFDEVLMLTLTELRVTNITVDGYSFFPDPLLSTVTIILQDNDARAMLVGTLTENTLSGSMVTVTVVNTEYVGTLSTANFTLATGLTGLTVSDVTDVSSTRATLTLAYEGEDFTADATLSVTVLASGHTGTDSLTTNEVAITANAVPTFGPATIDDQTYTVGMGITALQLPAASGGDGVLIYTLAPALPAGLTFDAQDRRITGTPESTQTATAYIYTVSDSDSNEAVSDSSSLSFTIQIDANPSGITGNFTGAVTERGVPNPDQAETTTGVLTLASGIFTAQTTATATDRAEGLGTYGRFGLTAEGEWTYTLDNESAVTNALSAGVSTTDVFTVVSAADESATQAVTITITGANDAPMADAGQDRNVISGSMVTLLGSGSDPEDTGDLLSYEWEQTAGESVSLSSTAVATPTFVAPTVPSATDLMFTLTVTDTSGLTDTAAVTFTVLADGAPVVSLMPGIDTLVEESDAIVLVVSLDATPTGLVLVQLDSLQTVPSATPANVTYGLDYSVILASTDPTCVPTDFSFDSAMPETLMSRRVVVPFPAGCASQTLMVSAIDDVDGLDETLTFSLVEEGASYAVTLIPEEAVRTLTVTDNEPVVMLGPLGDPFVTGRNSGFVTERNNLAVDVLLPDRVAGTSVTVNVAVSGDIDAGDVTGRDPLAGLPLTDLRMLVIDDMTTADIPFNGAGRRQFFTTNADGIVEDEETATVTLLAGDGYRLPATNVSRSVTILDSLRIFIPDTDTVTAVEGGAPATVTLRLSRGLRGSLGEGAVVFMTVLPIGDYTLSASVLVAGSPVVVPVRDASGNQFAMTFPFDQDDLRDITVTITATEDADTVNEEITLTLVSLDGTTAGPPGYSFFPNPPPTVTIILQDNDARAMLVGTLTENTLSGSMVTVTVVNTEYVGMLSTANFTLMTGLTGLTVSDVTDVSSTRATLTLAYEGEDFTADATLSVTVLASGHTGTDSLTTNEVAITANAVPTFDPATIADQTYTVGMGITALQLPAASDGDGALIYTLAPALPNGLIFDAQDRRITGTPESTQTATAYIYTVSDSDSNEAVSDSSSLSFTIQIDANPSGITGNFTGAVTERGAPNPDQAETTTGVLTLASGIFTAQTTATATDRAEGLGTYGRFGLTAEGEWTYTLDNESTVTNALSAGVSTTDVFTVVSAADESATQAVTITITGANDAPVADAGVAQTVTAGDPVTLSGSGSDPDTGDSIETYIWTQIGEPTVILTDADAATATFTAPTVATVLTFTLVVNDGSVDSAADTVTITVTDDDAVVGDIVLSPTSLTVSETGSASYNVSLSVAPSGQVDVAIVGGAGSGGLTFDPAILTFDVGNSDVAQAVTVTATVDTLPADRSSLTLSILHTASGGGYDDVEGSLSLTVLPQPGLVRDFTATPARGGRAVLSWEAPENAVAAAVTQYELQRRARSATEFVALETLAFGMTTTQFVLPRRSFVTSFEFRIRALAAGVVGEWVSSDPSPGALLSETRLEIEEGGTATYTVVLQTVPTDSVTVVIRSNNDDVTATDLMFTVDNWDVPQAVVVSAAQDADSVNDVGISLTHDFQGGGYGGVSARVDVSVLDDDPDVRVGFEASEYSVTENDSVEITVTLSAISGRELTVPVEVSGSGVTPDDYRVSVGGEELAVENNRFNVTFNSDEVSKTLLLSALLDETDESAGETAELAFTDLAAAGLAGTATHGSATVFISEVPEVIVGFDSFSYQTLEEGEVPAVVTVRLSETPGREVVITVVANVLLSTATIESDYTGLPAEVRFAADASAEDLSQTFEITAIDDSEADFGEFVNIEFASPLPVRVTAATGADPANEGFGASLVGIVDNDEAAADRILLSVRNLNIGEGGSETYTVRLNTDPIAEVTVAVTVSDGLGVTVDAPSLVFTGGVSGNWDTTQTVTVSAAADDDNAVNETGTISHTASSTGGYDGISLDVQVSVEDDDTAQLSVAAATVTEGETAIVEVSLDIAVAEGFAVNFATQEGGSATVVADYTATSGTLDFAGTAGEVQTFTVATVQDGIAETNETVQVSLSGLTPSDLPIDITGLTNVDAVTIMDGVTGDITGEVTERGVRNPDQTETATGVLTLASGTFTTQVDTLGTYGTFVLDVNAARAEEGAWTYTLDNVDPDTNALAAGTTRTDVFTVTTTDGPMVTVTIIVTGANDAPIITLPDLADRTFSEGEQINLELEGSDPDGDTPLAWELRSVFSLSGESIARDTGVFRWIPTQDGGGSTSGFEITLTDPAGASTEVRLELVIIDVDSERIVITGYFPVVNEGDPLPPLTGVVTDPIPGPTTPTYRIFRGSLPNGIMLNSDGTFSGTVSFDEIEVSRPAPNNIRTRSFEWEYSNGVNAAISLAAFVTTIDNPIRAILAAATPLTEVDLDGSRVMVTVVNTEYAGTLNMDDFSLATDVPGAVTVSGVSRNNATRATLTLAHSGEDIISDGTLSVTVLASGHTGDGSLTTNELPITANAVPTFGSATIADQTYTVGMGITVLQLPTADGGDGALIYTLAPDLPNGLTFDVPDRRITGTPEQPQDASTYTYTVSDSDSNERDSDSSNLSFTIQIDANSSGITGNFTGAVTERGALTPDQPETAAGVLTLASGTFTEQDGTTDRARGLGTYGTFVLAENGAWTYTLDNVDPDTNALSAGASTTDVFTVASAADPSATQVVTITITGANDAPVADAGVAQTVTARDPVTLSGSSSDPDTGDLLSYEWAQTGGESVMLSSTAAATPTFTAPDVDTATELTFTLVVSDGDLDSLPSTVMVTVSPDTAPVFDAVTIDQAYTVGVTITPLQLPAATGGNAPLIYSLGTTPALPPGLTFTPGTRTIAGTPTAMMAQTTYTLTVTDSDGINSDTETFTFTLRINAVATVTDVALTSDANDDGFTEDDNTYAIDDEIEATVTFSEEVTVNTVGGVPQLALTVGGSTSQAAYVSGSGTTDLVFSYTVLAGDLDSDGVSIGADALTVPSGSSIQDADEIDAVIVHAAVDAAAEHRVDGVVATVSGIEFMTTGPYVLGDPIEVAVTFSEAVTVSGTPQLPLIVGGITRQAAYVSNPDAATMVVFSYTVVDGDNDDDGVEVAANTLMDGGGAIRDVAGNNAELAHAAIDETVSQLVDTVIPVLIARAVNGDVVTLTYDEALDEGSVPSTSTYTLTRASGVVLSVTDVSISGDTVTLMLSEAVMSEDVVTLSYTVGSDSDPVQDVAGNDAADFTGETVTNDTSAVITGNFVGAVTERGASTPTQTETAEGMLDVAGDFAPQDGTTDRAGGLGTYGTFVLAVDGAWTYTLDNDLSVTNALAADMEVTEVFTVVSAADATVSEAVTITITGANDAPTAEAGDDRLVPQGAMETLDGTDSFDPDTDDTLTYEWVQSGGSSTVTLADMDSSVSTFITPDVNANTTLTFTLAVTDSGGVTDAATVTVTIEAGNFASAIDGPITGTVTEDAQRDTATGTLTVTDPDGGEPTFQAQSTIGTYGTFVLTTAGATSTWIYTLDNDDPDTNALAAGAMEMEAFRVQSSDNTPVRVVITINGANDAPVADAGVAQTVTAGETVMLDGTGSFDPDTGSIVTYAWSQIDGPSDDVTLSDTNTATVTFTAPSLMSATDLTFELVVSDGAADSLPTTVTVTVQPRVRVSDIEFSSTGPYTVGDEIEVTVTFTEVVVVSGTPRLPMMVGNATRAATTGDSGTPVLVFSYTVIADDRDDDGVSVAMNALELNGGTIQDADGNDADLDHEAIDAVEDNRVDLVAPSVVGVAITSTGLYTAGEVIELTVTFSEVVTVETGAGTPQLPMTVGTITRNAEYTATAPATTAVFNYTVVAGDEDDDGVEVEADMLTANGGMIRDAAGNNAALAHAAIAADAAQRVDAVIPVLNEVAVNGDVVTLTYDEALDEGSVPSTSTYTLTRTSGVVPSVTDVSINSDTVTLILSEAVVFGDVVTLSYTAGSNPVQDVAGNDAANFADQSVTNDTPVVITGNFAGAVTERGVPNPDQAETATGTLALASGDTFTEQTGTGGTYGSFVLDANGEWTYTLDNASTVTNALAEGVVETDVFTAVSDADTTVSQAVTITITGANDAPTADAGVAQTVPGGDPVTLSGRGSDPDTGDIIERYIWMQTDGTPTVELDGDDTATATFMAPDVDAATILTFTLVVNDGAADSPPAMVTVTVRPSIEIVGAYMVTVAEGAEIAEIATDDLSDLLPGGLVVTEPEFVVTSGALPTGIILNTDGSFAGTPSFDLQTLTDPEGDFSFTWVYRDSLGALTNAQPATITVTNTNRAPIITLPDLADRTFFEGEQVNLQLEGSDPDGDTPLVWALRSGFSIQGESLDRDTGVFRAIPPQSSAGFGFVTPITLTDPAGASTEVQLVLVIIDVDSAPIVTTNYFVTVNEGEPLPPLTGVVTDPIPGPTTPMYSIFRGSLPDGIRLNLDGTFSGTVSFDETQPRNVRFRVFDWIYSNGVNATDAQSGTVRVRDNPIRAILAAATPLTEVDLDDSTVTVTLVNIEYVPGDLPAEVFDLMTDVPGALTVSAVARVSDTTATLTLAYDGDDITADATLSVTVQPEGNTGGATLTTNELAIIANTVPTFTPATIADQTYTVGVGIDDLILPMAAGGNGTLTYTLTPALPNGLEFDDQALEISGRPETAQSAVAYIYTASDSDSDGTASDMDTIAFMITINENSIGGVTDGSVTEDAAATTAIGTLTLDTDTFTSQDGIIDRAGGLGTYGRFELTADGEWTYTLDNADPDTNALAEGVVETDVFTAMSASDGDVRRDVVITITGANDAPVADAGAGQLVLEGEVVTLSGSGSDPDTGDVIESYTWTQIGDTSDSVTLDDATTATTTFTALDVDTATELTFTLVVSDGEADSLPDTVTVTVRDTPDAGDVIILGEIAGRVTEDDLAANTASGALRVFGGEGTFTAQDGLTDRAGGLGTYGTFELATTGAWTYTLDNNDPDTDALAAGVSVTDTFTAVLDSGLTQAVTITITGSNDAPVADAGVAQTVTEGDLVMLSGRDSFDPDTGDVIESYIWRHTGGTPAVELTGDETSTLTFTAPDVDTATALTFTLVVSDGEAASLPATVTVTVMVMAIPDTAPAFDLGTDIAGQTYTVGVGITALQLPLASGGNGALSYTLVPLPDGLTLSDTNILSGTPTTEQVSTPSIYTATDVDGDTATITFMITINANPITGETEGSVTEDAAATTAIGTLTLDTGAFTSQDGIIDRAGGLGTYGRFELTADGEWTYTLDNADPDTNALAEGVVETDVFTAMSASDGDVRRDVVITITGANDAPVADAGAGQLVLEGEVVTLSGSGSDPDTGDVIESYTWTQIGDTSDSVTLDDATTATTTFTALDVDTATELTFTLVVSDGEADSLPDTVTVTVRDTPDAGDVIILGEIAGRVTEDDLAANTASGALRVFGGEGTFTAQDGLTDRAGGLGTYGTFELATTGAWTYTLDNNDPDTDALAAGVSVTDTFTAVLDSGLTQAVTITITGSNDAPVADAGVAQTVTEGDLVMLSGRDSFDPDTGDVIESYIWRHTGGTPAVELTGDETSTLTFTAPDVDIATALTFTLVVSDGEAASLPATVTVTVSPDTAPAFDAVTIDRVYTVGVTIIPLQLPSATGGNAPLIYSLDTTPALPLPQGLTFTPDTRTITGTPTAVMAQTTYTLTVTDSDGINPDTATFEFTLRINAVATVAMVTDVALTSDANDDGFTEDDNTYAIDDVIEATVTFSEEVTVNTVGGVPQLALTVGGSTSQAAYVSGSGTTDLVFSYTVLAGDLDSDGVSIGADALTVPSGSSIQDADEIDAVIVHAAVDAAAEHRVDGVVATVSGIEFMTTGPYVLGDPIEVAVTFSEEVTVSGAAQLPLIVGGFPRLAAYVSNPDATTMAVFSYTAAVGDNDDDGVEVAANTLTSGAGTIRDGAGNNAELAHAAIDEAVSQLVDTVIPVLIARAVNGDVVTLTYDEALDEGSVPSTSTYTLTRASGVVPLVTDVSISGDTVTLMLSEAVMSEDVVTLSYTVGSDSDPVQDVAGNDAADFTGETVTNDTSAVITGNFVGAVTERGASTPTQTETAEGMLDVAGDFAPQDGITATGRAGGLGTYGTFVLAVDGAWTYTLDNDLSVTNALAADMEVTEVFTVVSAADATVSEAVTITITGANDAPTAEAGDDRLVPQGAMETLDGTDSFDPDTDDTLTYEWVQSGGSSTVTLADMDSSVSTFITPDVNANTTLTFTLAVTDSGGVTDAATVTVTIEAGNFASAIDGPITGTVTEDAQRDTATGTLTVTDPDGGEPTFQAQSTTGTYGTFVLTTAVATSTWTYTLDNNDPDTNALAAGAMEMEAFRVQSSDNTPVRVVITINGANDAPTANAGVAQTVTAGETVMLDGSGSDDPEYGRQH